MNVYDFDNTIYDGESLVDFFVFCMKKKPSLIWYLPLLIYTLVLYKFRLLSIPKIYKLSSKISSVAISNKDHIDELVEQFWKKNRSKLKPKFLEMLTAEDVIITGSPRILIFGIISELKVLPSNVICSEFDLNTGCFEFICLRENKVGAFTKKYSEAHIENFYTDSLNDIPMMRLAKHSYLVKKKKDPELIDPKVYS